MTSSEMISVIVPVYKVQDYLDRCLDSIVGQTYVNLEIILVDDGSPDRCPEICDRWAERDGRIIVIHKQNGGVSSARNAGLKAAKGAWISFVDSDDWIHPQYFEILYEQSQKSKADVVAANLCRTEETICSELLSLSNISFVRVTGEAIFSNWVIRNFVFGKIYKAAVIKNKCFDEEISYGEDSLFNVTVFIKDNINVAYTSEPLYYYFDRKDSVVNTISLLTKTDLYEKYLEIAKGEERDYVKSIYLTEAMKRVLAARYLAKLDPSLKCVVPKCNMILNEGLNEYLPLRVASIKNRIIYAMFARIPQAYRLWRIIDDPTMLKWERSQRKKKNIE